MKLKYLFLLSFSFILMGQNHLTGQDQQNIQHANSANELNFSYHTMYMLSKFYSEADIQEMKELSPNKLNFLDYYYSASFQIKEGQNYSNDQVVLIDITTHNQSRSQTERVEILDEASGLYILLDSIETVSQQVGAPDHIKNNIPTGKIANY